MDSGQNISITIQWEGKHFPLEVPLSATIGKVKDMIYNSMAIPIHVFGQELFYLGPDFLSDETTVQQAGITNGSVLLLYRNFELTINLPNREYVWRTVSEDFTVGLVKETLVGEGGLQEQDIEGTALQLIHDDGRIVTLDDRSYLWAAGIVDAAHLRLVNVNP